MSNDLELQWTICSTATVILVTLCPGRDTCIDSLRHSGFSISMPMYVNDMRVICTFADLPELYPLSIYDWAMYQPKREDGVTYVTLFIYGWEFAQP